MAPIPENVQVPNPQKMEDDRETRVRFKKSWNHAYGGVTVQRYLEGEVADVSEVCAAVGVENGACELVDANKVDLHDPRTAVKLKTIKK